MADTENLNIGIVGAGGFAAFAAFAFAKVPGVIIKGVTDVDPSAAQQLAAGLNAYQAESIQALLDDSEIDLIYIATPPHLHYIQSKQALEAGKHVICEKPAALFTSEAEELASYARSNDLLYTVNLMQRYNPLYAHVKEIIEEQSLGDFLHGFFENYASDEKLMENHWFWNKEKSGGIFIEHGVHFFDMFDGWFGKGKLAFAMQIDRDGIESITDRVQAVVMYNNCPVNFYHGFNQPKALDRQEMRLQFDRGDITLYEWIPVKIRLHGLFKNSDLEKLKLLFPDAKMTIDDNVKLNHTMRGKFKPIKDVSLVTITSGNITDKMSRYEQLVISMITDQWKWIQDRSHKRVIDETNAVESLRLAEEATMRAVQF